MDLFKKFVEESHKLGIKIIVDVVINHLCDRKTYYSKDPNHYGASDKSSDVYWKNAPPGDLENLKG